MTGAPVGAPIRTPSRTRWRACCGIRSLPPTTPKQKLGGQSFDNKTKIYGVSANDLLLNLGVARFSADAAAVSEMKANYNTSGRFVEDVYYLARDRRPDHPIIPY